MQAIYQKDLVSHVSVDKGKIALPFITVFAAFLLSIMFGELDALVYVFLLEYQSYMDYYSINTITAPNFVLG